MKKLYLSLALGISMLTLMAGDAAWTTDLPAAQKKALSEKKHVLIDFTGSDWCGWCIKLQKEVFSTKEFQEYAAKNLALVEVDFPKNKPQSAELKKANDALQKQYKIEGYPTLIVLDGSGKKLGELGYQPGGPKAFIAALEKLTKK